MFGINDTKAAGQDPVMPQPLDSPEPELSYSSSPGSGTAPPLTSGHHSAPAPAAQPPAFASTTPPVASPSPITPTLNAGPAAEELLQIKQQALHSLVPLVDQLDQTPEERFKTTMMMLQASDNPQLVRSAYAAANQISDEKARAQALLDVVNEINYFTHHDAA